VSKKFIYDLDPTTDKLLLVHYPAGGFGHFLYYLLTQHAKETALTPSYLKFSDTGDAHRQTRYFPDYMHDYRPDFSYSLKSMVFLSDDSIKVLVCDNGTEADMTTMKKNFPNARILRVCIEPESRLTLLKLGAQKSLRMSVTDWVTRDILPKCKSIEPMIFSQWAIHKATWWAADKYYIKWHPIRDPNIVNLSLTNFLLDPIKEFEHVCSQLNLTVVNYDKLISIIDQWKEIHAEYLCLPIGWQRIEHALDLGENLDLSFVDDWYTRANVFYNVCKKYNLRVPVTTFNYDPCSKEVQHRILAGFADTNDILNFVEYYDNI